ncbi:hypothetical protein BX600DRAFT_7076 [Xylariales sp. PMI_506]|nr:hypothetical protein BX600DRAFT_7076 [Xylariales sp. PMI_506]
MPRSGYHLEYRRNRRSVDSGSGQGFQLASSATWTPQVLFGAHSCKSIRCEQHTRGLLSNRFISLLLFCPPASTECRCLRFRYVYCRSRPDVENSTALRQMKQPEEVWSVKDGLEGTTLYPERPRGFPRTIVEQIYACPGSMQATREADR